MKIKILFILFILYFSGFSQILDNSASGTPIPPSWTSVNDITTTAIQGTTYYLVESSTAPVYDYLISQAYNIVVPSTFVINFDIATFGAGSNSPLKVDISLDNGATWGSTQTSVATPTSTTYISTSVTFAGPISSPQLKFRFYDGIDGNKAVRIKNIVITAPITCTPPTNPTGLISGTTPACNNTTLSFSGTAVFPVINYWQTTATGTSTSNDTSSNLNVITSGNYYVRAYNPTTMCWSTSATPAYAVVINTLPIITAQPSNITISSGASTLYSVTATGSGLTYQWQVNTGSGFNNLINGAPYTNVNSMTLNITAASVGLNGNIYRCIVTGGSCGSVTSNNATLTVNAFVPTGTAFKTGELLFVAFDGQVLGSGGVDEYLVATMVDIIPGTQFSIVNSRYEAGAAANVRTNKWGGGGDVADEAPYVALITYNGTTNIPAGSIMGFTTNSLVSVNWFSQVNVVTGTLTTDRTADFTGITSTILSPNISTSGSDQIYLVQGNFTSDGSITALEANYFLNGTLLHGLTNRVDWIPLNVACNGLSVGGNTRESRLPASLTCFNVSNSNTTAISGFYQNDKEHGSASIRTIINSVADVALNWTLGTTRYTKDPTSSSITRASKTFIIGAGNPAGQWIGDKSIDSNNWFNCANWEGLKVPDASTDVIIASTALENVKIDFTETFSDDYLDVATCKNLTITGKKLLIESSVNNKIEVFGDLVINSTGVLDMDDSNNATPDGQIYLFGNWTNNLTNSAFEEGNGTVSFNGSLPQIINNITPEGTEVFYNLILNNNFDTSVSNDLIATGNLTLATGKILTIPSNDYVSVNKVLANNGTINVANNASLVQTENGFTNTGSGTTNVTRDTTPYQKYDYTYWSSPIQNNTIGSSFSAWRQNFSFEYDTTKFSDLFSGVGFPQIIAGSDTFDDNDDDWVIVPQSTTMVPGRGYAIMENQATHPTTTSVLFSGAPNNGLVTASLKFSANAADTTDDLNFVGNPYPSAISANDFINANLPNISGTLYFWTHKDDVNTINPGPDLYNFTNDDYAYYNLTGGIATNATVGTGSNTGSNAPTGFIASGQGFFVEAQNEVDLIFSNSMRAKTYSNTNFFRNANLNNNQIDRIWLNLTNTDGMFSQQLIGYFDNATLENDQAYDAQMLKGPSNINFYSQSQSQFYKIQARPTFNSNDTVLLGFTSTANSNFSISIDSKEGVFDTQNIYLQDNLLNIVHDLKQAPYNFASTYGTFDDRFVLRYENSVLSNNTFVNEENQVIISAKDTKINIVSNTQKIKQIEVFDVLGRRLFNNDLVNEKTFTTTSILAKNQTLIVKIKLENGEIITRKIII